MPASAAGIRKGPVGVDAVAGEAAGVAGVAVNGIAGAERRGGGTNSVSPAAAGGRAPQPIAGPRSDRSPAIGEPMSAGDAVNDSKVFAKPDCRDAKTTGAWP
jgi:hypothetical protein